MPLTAQETRETAVVIGREDLPGLSKPDMVAAVQAVDAWCTSNQASYVAALPEPFKTASSPVQKARLLAYVAMRRAGERAGNGSR